MAVTIATTSIAMLQTTSANLVFAHSVTSGGMLVVTLQLEATTSGTAFTGVDYGGTTMTELVSAVGASGITVDKVHIYALTNPITGTNNVTVSVTAVTTASMGYSAVAITYLGVDQATPLTTATATAVSNTATSTIVTVADNAVVQDNIIYKPSSQTMTAATTGQQVLISTTHTGRYIIGNSYVNATSAGSYTLSWTLGAADAWAITTIALYPTSSGGGAPQTGIMTPRSGYWGDL